MMYQWIEWVTFLTGCKWISRTLLKFSILMFWDLSFASFASLLHHMNVPWSLEALDAPDVTFISRRADISGEYTFAGAQMLCKRWCEDSSDHWKIIGFSNHPAWWKQFIAYEDPHLIRNNQRQFSCCNSMRMDPNWGTNQTPAISNHLAILSQFLSPFHGFPHVFPTFSPCFPSISPSFRCQWRLSLLLQRWHVDPLPPRGAQVAGGRDGTQGEQLHRLCGSPGDDASGLWIPETWQDEILGIFMRKKPKRTENVWGKYGRCWLMSWHCWHHFLLTKPSAEEREWSLHGVFCNSGSIRRTSDHETKDVSITCSFWDSFWNSFPSQEFVEEVACVECIHGAMECRCQLSLPCCAQHHSCAWSTSSGPVSELVFTLRVEDRPVTSSWRNPFINYCKSRYLIIKQLPSTMYLKALKVTQHIIISLCEYITIYNFYNSCIIYIFIYIIIYYNLHEPSNPGWFHPIFPSLSPEACNARICGAYHLVGVREGRPLYLLPGKKAVIRYAPESDRPSMGILLGIFKGQQVGKVEIWPIWSFNKSILIYVW